MSARGRLVLVLVLLAGCASGAAGGRAAVSSRPTREVLPNGVVLIAQEHRASDVVALQLWMRVGGRDETADELGLSHYLEHMLFKGTPTRPPGSIDALIEGLGGTSNAFTSQDYTHFDVVLPAQHMRAGIELLADIAVNASFEQREPAAARRRPARRHPALRAAGVSRPGMANGRHQRARRLRRRSPHVHPRRLALVTPEPAPARSGSPGLCHRGRLRRLGTGGAHHRGGSPRSGQSRAGRGDDSGGHPAREGGGRDRGRAPARHHHGREQLRVRHRDRRRPREDLRPGRDHVDARRRDRVFVAAAQDHRGPDPGGGPEVLRRRQLRSGALPPSSVSIMRRSIRSTAAVVIAVLVAAMIGRAAPAIAAEDVTRERLDNGVTVLVRENPLAPVVAVALLVRMGTPESLKRIDHAAIVAWYRQFYRPERIVLAVSGQVRSADVVAEARKLFGGLPRGGELAEPRNGTPASGARRLVIAQPAQQAQIAAGGLAPALADADHAAVKVLATVLGGGMAGRLFAELRDKEA